VKWLSDSVIEHLCRVCDWPNLDGTSYEIVDELGHGGMASVYLATDRKLDRQVALKVLRVGKTGQLLESRLLEEARIIAGLEHPGIVPVHDLGVLPDGRVYYAMKLVKGKRLDEAMESAGDLFSLLRMFEKICHAVAFAHAHHVIHRDLKPQNVMVGPFGEVLVLDWGVAKIMQSRTEVSTEAPGEQANLAHVHHTDHGTVLGTPGYMAPEQACGEVESVDKRSDVYALGAILYFLLTGRHPGPITPGDSATWSMTPPPRALKPSVPKPLEGICLKAMSAACLDRYQSVEDLSRDVGRYLAQLPVEAYREGAIDTLRRLFAKYRTAIVLIVAYLIVRIVLLIWTGT
jgi:serine/threonine protein kinase